MDKKKVKYSGGDLFIIETKNKTKFLGLIAKRKGKTKLLLGYFWKLNFDISHDLILDKNNVILITKFSGLGFELSNWQIVGKYSKWSEKDWQMPEFKKYDELRGIYYAVRYNDDFEYVLERKISNEEANQLFEHGSHGYISLENELMRTD